MAYQHPNFVPLIAGGSDPFGSLGQQRFAWEGFNNRTARDNFNSFNQAQQDQNRWLAALAAMERNDRWHQDELDQRSDALKQGILERTRSEAEGRRRFDIGTGLTKADLDLRNKHWDRDEKKVSDALSRDNATAENYGKTNVDEVERVGKSVDSSLQDLADAQSALNDAAARAGSSLPSDQVLYVAKQGIYVPKRTLTPEVKKAVDDVNESLAAARSNLAETSEKHKVAVKSFQDMQAEARSLGIGFVRGPKGYSVIHYPSGRSWNPTPVLPGANMPPPDRSYDENFSRMQNMGWSALAAPQAGPAVAPALTPPDDSGWAGMQPPGAPAPAPVQAPPGAAYPDPQSVKAALRAGKITRDQAAEILQLQF